MKLDRSCERIAVIGNSASYAVSFRGELIKTLIQDGHDVFLYCNDYTCATTQAVQDLGATAVHYSLNRSGFNPFADIRATYALSKDLKKRKISVSVSYCAKPAIFGTIASKMADVSKIYAMLEGLGWAFTARPENDSLKCKLIKLVQVILYAVAFRFADKVIFLNQDDESTLKGFPFLGSINSEILGPIGVPEDFLRFKDLDLGTVKFVFVGRLLFDKGIREFIAAADKVKKVFPDAKFIAYGEPDEKNPASLSPQDLKDYRDKGIVQFEGYTTEMVKVYENASVVVLPSYREGFPRTIQEAMGIGRTIIASNVPGCRHAIQHNRHGFLVKPFSSDDLANQMIHLIKNKKLILEMGERSHKHACQNFRADNAATRLKELMFSVS